MTIVNNIQMADIEYRNHSISQLVNQLNILGSLDAVMRSAHLIAIHPQDHQAIRRFKNSHNQQFFLTDASKKKYFYSSIISEIDSITVNNIASNIFQGFNVTIVMQYLPNNKQIMDLFELLFRSLEEPVGLIQDFYQNQVFDVIGSEKKKFEDLEDSSIFKFYRFQNSVELGEYFNQKIRKEMSETVRVMRLKDNKNRGKNENRREEHIEAKGEIRFIFLPASFLSKTISSNIHLSTVKNQLTQILNYIKINPKKRYEQLSKVITKRHPLTNYLTTLLLQDSSNYVLNWITDEQSVAYLGKFEFFDKLNGISNLLKKSLPQKDPIVLDRAKLTNAPAKLVKKQSVSPAAKGLSQTNFRSPINQLSQLDYCRSLERKTHKYSIFNGEQEDQSYSDPEHLFQNHQPHNQPHQQYRKNHNISKFSIQNNHPPIEREVVNESEQISILKAQHAVEVSQYHQTIQNLNKKMLALTNQKGLEQLYTIHERQIMLLELKIAQLRKDIHSLTQDHDQKSLKGIIRKLNEELKKVENKATNQKISQGKIIILEKQIKELTEKLSQSQKARKKLSFQLQGAAKRLKMRDHQIQIINKQEEKKLQVLDLSFKDQQIMKQVQILITGVRTGKQLAAQYLSKKINNILADLSNSRNVILSCNDFLVQLQDHIQSRLGDKDAEVVLDCNRFIRGFLIDNLSIL